MNRGMMKLLTFSLASMTTALLLSVGLPAAQAQTPAATATRRIPFNRTVPTTCGEKRIRLTGEFQAQYNVTRDASGETFVEGNIDADRIKGLGLTSRARYEAAGATHIESRGPSPISFNYVFNFALNKSGTTESLMGHVKFRINVNARGGVTTSVLDANIDCTK